MAVTVERLIATLEARFDKYEKSLDRALGLTNRQFTAIERRGKAMEARMASIGTGIGRRFVGALVAGLSAREIARFADTAIRIENALKVTGLAGEELARVYASLRESAMRNYAPLETLATLYSRLGLAQKSLGVSVDEMLNFTDKVALALRVQGTTAEEARGALIQLSQAMGAGIVRAEEFNSIVEGAPSILRAAAAGLKEAGGEVSKLRKLVIDGKLSSQAFFRAFEAGAPILEKMVASADVTLSQAMTNLNNALLDTVKEFNEATGAANRFAGGINNIARAIGDFDTAGFIRKIQEAGGAIEKFLNDVGNAGIFSDLAEALGVTEGGLQINIQTQQARDEAAVLDREVRLLQERIALNSDLGIDNSEAIARLNEVSGRLASLREQITGMPEYADIPGFNFGGPATRAGKRRLIADKTVSIKDHPVDPDGTKQSKAPRRTASDRFDEDIQAIRDRTAALIEEQKIVGKSYYEQERRRMALDLEQQALRDVREEARRKGQTDWQNAELTPEQVRRIDEASEAYARQADELRKIEEAQGRAESAAQEFYDTFKSGMIGAITGAEDFKDALSGVSKKLGDLLLNSAFDALMGGRSATGSGGWLTAIFKGLGFRERGGPVRKGQPYIVGEKRAELFVPDQNGKIVPRVPQVPSTVSRSGAGDTRVTYAPQIDARGASVEAVARLEQVIAKDRAEFESRTVATIRRAQKARAI